MSRKLGKPLALVPGFHANYIPADMAQSKLEADMLGIPQFASLYVNRNRLTKQYFFMTGHMFVFADFTGKRGFVPSTCAMPYTVVPREGVEDGIVDSVEKYVRVFLNDMQEINPYEVWPELVQEDD